MKGITRHLGWGGAALATFALTGIASPAWADDAELRATLRELAAKIEAMQAQQKAMQAKLDAAGKVAAAAPASAGQAVVGGDIPGSFKLPGSKTSIQIGGYVKGLVAYNERGPLGDPAGSDTQLVASTIPLSNAPDSALRKNYWKESAKESRITFRTNTPSDYGLITTFIEADFYGTAGTEQSTNSHNLRLRHAWATFGNFGAGQFWSNMANLTSPVETVDFTPQSGTFGGLRQPSIRWTQPTSYGFWSVALENPDSRFVNTAGVASSPDNDKSLDANAKIHFKAGPGEFEVVGAYQNQSTAEAALAPAVTTGRNFRIAGWGGAVSGYISTFGDYDRILFSISATKDGGRFQGGRFPDALLVTTGTGAATTGVLKGIDTTAWMLAYRHRWTPTLRSTLAHSYTSAKIPDGLTTAGKDLTDNRYTSTHLNLIWSPTPMTDFGMEIMKADRRVVSGLTGDLTRFMTAVKVKY